MAHHSLLIRLIRSLLIVGLGATPSYAVHNDEQAEGGHFLMPGIQASELSDVDWPRAFHDRLATGFSPLTCGMRKRPIKWSQIDIGGLASWVRAVPSPSG